MDFLAVDPQQRITISLPGYNGGHPPISCKYMTGREWRQYRTLWRAIDGTDDEADAAKLREMFTVAALTLGSHAGDEWDVVLTDAECSVVLDAIAEAHLPNRDRRKNSDSPSQSDTGQRAPSNAAATAKSSSNAGSATELHFVGTGPSAHLATVVV